jgi:hypothetical protein
MLYAGWNRPQISLLNELHYATGGLRSGDVDVFNWKTKQCIADATTDETRRLPACH